MATIALEGLSFFAHHGVYQEEKENGGQFEVDIYFHADINEAAASDNLRLTIDYTEVYAIVKAVMEESVDLLESLTVKILDQVMVSFPAIESCKVRVSKLDPPLEGPCLRTFIEDKRQRK